MKTKLIFTIVYLCTVAGYVFAQTPGFNYQAVLRNDAGEPMTNADVTLHFSLIDGPTNTVIYKENQVLMTDELGILTCMIGSGTVESGIFEEITGVPDLSIKIEAELPGETGMVEIGNSKVGIIPYALYGKDEDSDPGNEMQTLSLEGDSLKISGTPGVSLAEIKSPLQKLSGGYLLDVDESGKRGATVPTGEFHFTPEHGVDVRNGEQHHSITPNTSLIEDGIRTLQNCYGTIGDFLGTEQIGQVANSLNLEPAVVSSSFGKILFGPEFTDIEAISAPGEGFSWQQFGSTTRTSLQIGPLCKNTWQLGESILGAFFADDGQQGFDINSNIGDFGAGSLVFVPTAGKRADDYGGVFSTANSSGLTTLSGAVPGADPQNGFQIVFNGQNFGTISTINAELAGTSSTYGANGQLNTSNGTFAGDSDGGAVTTYDQSGNLGAYVWTKNDGTSQVGADQFVMTASPPGRSDHVATFSAPVGGEAAAYDRGTATLVKGEATVICPEYFGWVADENSMTVTITPLSADSKGIAVIEKSNGGFKVKELNGGSGNYSFDYLVMCKRKGLEDFEVVRKKPEMMADENAKILEKLPKGPIKSIRDLYK